MLDFLFIYLIIFNFIFTFVLVPAHLLYMYPSTHAISIFLISIFIQYPAYSVLLKNTG